LPITSWETPMTPPLYASRRRLLAGLASLPVLARPALAAAYPDRPLRLVVPFAAGGISDILARAMAQALLPVLGQPVVVENRPGAGGNLGSEQVAHGAADGYTLLCGSPATIGIAKPLYGQLNYDPDRDLVPVGLMGAQANLLLTSPAALPAPTLEGLLAAAKATPGELNFGSGGIGSLAHLTAELFAADAGVTLTHVPYRGSPPAMADLMSGRIQLMFDAVTTAVPMAEAGSIRMLGAAMATRPPGLPAVPSLVELGFPRLDAPNWFGLFAPAGVPAPVLARLRQAMAEVTGSAAWGAALLARQATPFSPDGTALEDFLAAERLRWAATVRASGATAS
jgi:tripartite-type tricarboxylate transporter receptor subunit TctC